MGHSPPWFRPRNYLHFDHRVGLKKAEALVKEPSRVASHAFYPLINYTIHTPKIRRDPVTKKIIRTDKERLIQYAAHLDAHIFAYYNETLGQAYEKELRRRHLASVVLAFRRLGKSNIDFAKLAFDEVRRLGDCVAFAFDITKFFDRINHAILKRMWGLVLDTERLPPDHFAIFQALTRFASVERSDLFAVLGISPHNPGSGRFRLCNASQFRDVVRHNKLVVTNWHPFGIPQGTPISALLSNIYLLELDSALSAEARIRGGQYLRYCDDILLIVPTGHEAGLEVLVASQLRSLSLDVNPSKTEVSRFANAGLRLSASRPLQYLGFLFDGERIILRSAALAKFSGRLNKGVWLAKATAKSRNLQRQQLGLPPKPLYKRKLYRQYSHLGKRNFVSYGLNAARILESRAIKCQLRPLWTRLRDAIDKA